MAVEEVNGVRLCYEVSGSGEVPLVFVHGSWGSLRQWDPVVSALAESFRVLTYDRRGHGDSENPSGQGSVRDDVGDLGGLIDCLGFSPAYVVGNSFGSSIALRLACERRDLFRGLIVHEPPLFSLLAGDPDAAPILESMGESMSAVVKLLEARDHAEATERFFEGMALAPGEWTEAPPEFRQAAAENAPTFLDETRDPEALNFDLDWIAGFEGPVLLTTGERSPAQYAPVIRKLATALPQAETFTFPGLGHVPHVTHPTIYVESVTSFVQKQKV